MLNHIDAELGLRYDTTVKRLIPLHQQHTDFVGEEINPGNNQ